MKATMTSTNEIVTIAAVGYPGQTQARVWEGATENGVRFVAYIPLVQVHYKADNKQFERELLEHKRPDPDTRKAIDARML